MWHAFRSSRRSRLPVYDGTIDHIVGVLLLKDLMQHRPAEPFDLLHLVKQTLFVPESKHTLDLLRELQMARTQLAVAVDEFGSVAGLVTVEDLLEEVFGEIQEGQEAGEEIRLLPDGDYLVSGGSHVEDLEEKLGVTWERSGFDTVAGLLMVRLGRVPKVHEQVDVGRSPHDRAEDGRREGGADSGEGAPVGYCPSACLGNSRRNVAPWPGSLSTPTLPPWSSTICFTMDSPMPMEISPPVGMAESRW